MRCAFCSDYLSKRKLISDFNFQMYYDDHPVSKLNCGHLIHTVCDMHENKGKLNNIKRFPWDRKYGECEFCTINQSMAKKLSKSK